MKPLPQPDWSICSSFKCYYYTLFMSNDGDAHSDICEKSDARRELYANELTTKGEIPLDCPYTLEQMASAFCKEPPR